MNCYHRIFYTFQNIQNIFTVQLIVYLIFPEIIRWLIMYSIDFELYLLLTEYIMKIASGKQSIII